MSAALREYGHIIDGGEVNVGEVKERRNPADNRQVVALWNDGTPEALEAAIRSASQAGPAFAETAACARAEILLRTARILEEQRDQFAGAMTDEIGKLITLFF